jgi:hypothetical protein
MSIKSKVLAGAATLSVIAGGGVGGARSNHADATPSCGSECRTYFTAGWGSGAALDVYKRSAKVGQKIILWNVSNSDPAQDFTYSRQGTVKDFYAAGLVSAAFNKTYGNDHAFELEFAPYGVDTGLCVGVAHAARDLTSVTLQPCGVSSKTVWVKDQANEQGAYKPLINGSTNAFSHPQVLTNHGGAVITYHTQTFSDGSVYDNQLWNYESGVL